MMQRMPSAVPDMLADGTGYGMASLDDDGMKFELIQSRKELSVAKPDLEVRGQLLLVLVRV